MTRTLSALVLAAVVSAASPAMAAEKSVTLAVDNMYCSACPHIVKQSLAKVAGVGEVAVMRYPRAATERLLDERPQLGLGLRVAVQVDAQRVKAGAQRERELAARRHVARQTFSDTAQMFLARHKR